jgi:hypothetical protein
MRLPVPPSLTHFGGQIPFAMTVQNNPAIVTVYDAGRFQDKPVLIFPRSACPQAGR